MGGTDICAIAFADAQVRAGTITFSTGLGGFTPRTFTQTAQAAYASALATHLAVGGAACTPSAVSISNVRSAGGGGSRRLNSARGVRFDVAIQSTSQAAAEGVMRAIGTLFGAESQLAVFKRSVKAQLVGASGSTREPLTASALPL